jgi:hypothetical protein
VFLPPELSLARVGLPVIRVGAAFLEVSRTRCFICTDSEIVTKHRDLGLDE